MTLTLEQAPAVQLEETVIAENPVDEAVPPITSLLSHLTLMRLMISRDFKGRYRGSLLGALWLLFSRSDTFCFIHLSFASCSRFDSGQILQQAISRSI